MVKSNSKSSVRPAPPRPIRRQQVRIIGGNWKRTPLPVQESAGLRPTPDRVRETVFNWLTFLLDGHWAGVHCLDLFAGTGALGLEAASRGAARVLLVEQHSEAVQQLEAIRQKLDAKQVTIVRGDARSVAQGLPARSAGAGDRFNLIFLDPPYHADWLPAMLPLCTELLAQDGLIYAEAEFALEDHAAADWFGDWEIVRSGRAGMVFFHLLQRRNSA